MAPKPTNMAYGYIENDVHTYIDNTQAYIDTHIEFEKPIGASSGVAIRENERESWVAHHIQ